MHQPRRYGIRRFVTRVTDCRKYHEQCTSNLSLFSNILSGPAGGYKERTDEDTEMLYALASLALPALIGLVVISVYQPDALVQHPWLEYPFWSSLGIGVVRAGLDFYYCLAPFSSARTPPRPSACV